MTAAYTSLLMSVGISVAFIDVVPPKQPSDSHIYLMFDTGIPASRASVVSENPKRYVIKRNDQGKETIWLPIETTAIKHGFDAAWETGAEEYFQDVEIGLGVVKGWVKLIDVESIE